MNQEIIFDITTVGGGFLVGMLTGYFLRKLLKLVLFALGGVLSILLYLQYQGLITMNMDKIQNITDKVITTIPKAIPIISQMEDKLNIVPYGIGDLTIPFLGSLAAGITTGFLRR